jgi:hypothetical protein
MHKIQSILFASLVAVLVLEVSPSTVLTFTGPLVRIGMSRRELGKALPRYAKEFATKEPRVLIEQYDLHGMRGHAEFIFNTDRLYLFTWEHPCDAMGPNPTERAQYATLLKGLQADWGPGKLRVSASDASVPERFWTIPNARCHTAYSAAGTHSPANLKFLMADSAWLESVIPPSHR